MSIFSCKDTVRLVSDSLDGPLCLTQRLAMRVHLLGCPMCSRFRRQLAFLHRAAQQFEANEPDRAEALSAEARARIRRAMEQETPLAKIERQIRESGDVDNAPAGMVLF